MDTGASSECDESSESEGEQSEFVVDTQDSTQEDCEFDVDSDSSEENEWNSDDEEIVDDTPMETDGSDDAESTDEEYFDNASDTLVAGSRRKKKPRRSNKSTKNSRDEFNEEVPPNYMICELCKRDGELVYVKHRDSFSAEVKRGIYGERGVPFCLDHTAGVQRNYVSYLEKKGARSLINAPGPPDEADDGSCFHCRKPGHWVRDCPDLKQNDGSVAKPQRFTYQPMQHSRRGACFKCGREGHWAYECPGLQAPGASSVQRSTGASFHAPQALGGPVGQHPTLHPVNGGAYASNFNPPPEEAKKEVIEIDLDQSEADEVAARGETLGQNAAPSVPETTRDEKGIIEIDLEGPEVGELEWAPAQAVTPSVLETRAVANYEPHVVKLKGGMKMKSITTFFEKKR